VASRGCAYLALVGRLFKIGKSANPGTRVKQLPKRLGPATLLHSIPSADPGWLERRLHSCFADKQAGGEMFLLSPGDVSLVCSLAACDGPEDAPAWLLRDSGSFCRTTPDEFRTTARKPGQKQINLWMPEETYAALEDLAGRTGRTMTGEALAAIGRHLAAEPEVVNPPLPPEKVEKPPGEPMEKRVRKPKEKEKKKQEK